MLGTGLVLTGLLAAEAARWADTSAGAAAAQIREGMLFADAERALARNAWKHTRCVHAADAEHLFWYGLPVERFAAIVYVQTERRPDGEVVRQVATEPDYVLIPGMANCPKAELRR